MNFTSTLLVSILLFITASSEFIRSYLEVPDDFKIVSQSSSRKNKPYPFLKPKINNAVAKKVHAFESTVQKNEKSLQGYTYVTSFWTEHPYEPSTTYRTQQKLFVQGANHYLIVFEEHTETEKGI